MTKKLLATTLVALALLISLLGHALAGAPKASAFPSLTAYDMQYINTLIGGGLIIRPPYEVTVQLGHNVCLSLYHQTPREEANSDSWWAYPPGSPEIYFLVKTSITFYCPQYLPQVDW